MVLYGFNMSSQNLIYATMFERYQSQRDRREQIRGSVATPVSALAFSVYTLAWVSDRIDIQQWQDPVQLVSISLMFTSVLFLLLGAFMIMRMEKNIIYIDPPDLEELVHSEKRLQEQSEDPEYVKENMEKLLIASYDIIYRRYFASNEQASRDRTRGLHLIVIGLCIIMATLVIQPFFGVK